MWVCATSSFFYASYNKNKLKVAIRYSYNSITVLLILIVVAVYYDTNSIIVSMLGTLLSKLSRTTYNITQSRLVRTITLLIVIVVNLCLSLLLLLGIRGGTININSSATTSM